MNAEDYSCDFIQGIKYLRIRVFFRGKIIGFFDFPKGAKREDVVAIIFPAISKFHSCLYNMGIKV
jgi:hypothetical protein